MAESGSSSCSTPSASSADPTPGPSRSRRRYKPGSARSKTIELGTLSEVEEDLYHNRKDLNVIPSPQQFVSQDDSCIGSVRRPTKGSVRSLARHLSERHKADKVAREDRKLEQESEMESNGRLHRRNTTCVSNPMDEVVTMRSNIPDPRIHRTTSERRVHPVPEPFSKWSPTHSEDKHNFGTHPEYHHPHSSTSRPGSIVGGLSRSSSMVGRMLVYDPRTMSLVDPRFQPDPRIDPRLDPRLSEFPMPVWFPPPGPLYLPLGAPTSNMPFPPTHKMVSHRKPSMFAEICCGGIAQLLWTIICIILMGVVSTLILALFYV